VVLDHVGIGRFNREHQPPDELGLVCGQGSLEQRRLPVGVAQRDQEDPIPIRVEPRRLQVERQPPQVVEAELAEVGAPRRDQVLLFGRQTEQLIAWQIAQAAQRRCAPPRRSLEHRRGQRARALRADEKTQLPAALELAIADRVAGVARRFGLQACPEVLQVSERRQQQPGPIADLLPHQPELGRCAPPHAGASARFGPDRDDARRRVPAPEPFVLGAVGRQSAEIA
jgi:hypothetical protein